ncbi:cytochrome c4 [uncultured Aquabacterium sp.]|jgi:cytochrome c553|uniref:c-type cytochrome n=1 Tax=uncultured Aquabacterium sp. TaxID=158753 RepID=UPI00262B3F27|nr:cytochrome c4 [uncultured Aquabacterium sp.]
MGQRKSSKNACIGVLLCLLAAIPLGSLAAGTQGRKGGPSQASPTMPRPGDAALGQGKADAERCIECHGADGQGQGHSNGPEGKFARLAGQQAAYIVKQIQDFRSGARKHDQMAIMARSITDEDAADIAAYFASLPSMRGDARDVSELGRRLYEQGDSVRGVPACAACHGPRGEGQRAQPLSPVLGGQEWRYLDQQLRNWRSGDRRNSPGGVMSDAIRPLTDTEIEALASHLSGLSAHSDQQGNTTP